MPVVVVANPKGGVGKSTLATNVAGYLAGRGHAVALGDLDRQQSARLWLQLRPVAQPAIAPWHVAPDDVGRPPKGTTHAVLDTPAGLQGAQLRQVLRQASHVIVPLQASVFDIFATRQFLDELAGLRQASRVQIGLVAMRVDERTIAADKLQEFIADLGLPLLGRLRDTQNYVHLAAHGLTVFDVTPSRVARDLEQWQGLCAWLDRPAL